MMKNQYLFSEFMGVDVSKAKLDFAFSDDRKTLAIDNTQEQIVSELIGCIDNPESTIVVKTSGFPFASRIPNMDTTAITTKTGIVIAANHRKMGRAAGCFGFSFMGVLGI